MNDVCSKCDGPGPFFKRKNRKSGRTSQCTSCINKRQRKYMLAHPEKQKLYSTRWRGKNPERYVASTKRANARNKAQRIVSMRAWKRANLSHVRAMDRQRYRKNPEPARNKNNRRRAIKCAATATLTNSEWLEILEYFNYACAYCLRDDKPLTQEHVLPISRGGGHTAENVVPACKPCNSKKKDRPIFMMAA